MKNPRKWTFAKLKEDCAKSAAIFRKTRGKESLSGWVETNARQQAVFGNLFRLLGIDAGDLLESVPPATFRDPALLVALRYLAAPPISQDDLKTLSGASKDWRKLAHSKAVLKKVLRVIYRSLDPVRFPWLLEKRKPTRYELKSAELASALLATSQQVATSRRNLSKTDQEQLVKTVLTNAGFERVRSKRIKNLSDAPSPGQFCGECRLGSRNADIVVRLKDGRIVAIECKVSNSALNSVKRVNNDAAVKATVWTSEFGTSLIVPVAVLAGVFDASKLKMAQDQRQPLYLFWAHRLDDLINFVR